MTRLSTNSTIGPKSLGDLLTDIKEGRLIPKPHFQRRLVWNNKVKEEFLETVLNEYPFPEIFVAVGKHDQDTKLKRTKWLVDGQQRLTTLLSYVNGDQHLILKKVAPFKALSESAKQAFSEYIVAVRDLGPVSDDEVREIFRRINSTDYALKAMERLNALYSGEFKTFCENLCNDRFFRDRDVFSKTDFARMRDIDFCVILVATMLSTYYGRGEKNEEFLRRFDNEFPESAQILARLKAVFAFIDEMNLDHGSRAFKKTDLLTLLVELDVVLNNQRLELDARQAGRELSTFYDAVDTLFKKPGAKVKAAVKSDAIAKYLKAATKATNDKYARMDRAEVISALLVSTVTRAKRKKEK